MFLNRGKVKTLPPQFYGLKTEDEVRHHLMNTDVEYDPAKTAIAEWFGVPYNEVESLSGYVPGAMDKTPQGALTGIAIVAGNRFQSMKANGNAELANNPDLREKLYREARSPMLVPIPKNANGRSKILAHPETFREGLWIVKAGGKEDPCIFIFKDGQEITADGIPTYGKGLRNVSMAYTTMDNDIDGEQLLAWQQERRDNRRAA